jgi:hypothetical protein
LIVQEEVELVDQLVVMAVAIPMLYYIINPQPSLELGVREA